MDLNPVSDALLDELRAELAPAVFREIAPSYLQEPRGLYSGNAGAVLAPSSTAEVAAIIRAANKHRVGVVPYGGGTGLVGGQIWDGPAPIILSLEKMNAIREVYPLENVMIAEAGAILADVQQAAEKQDRLFPLSLSSEGSCRIGGNLATNAGGVNVLRYGNTRQLCLGLEAVLPDGTVLNGLTRLRKDNTGYDLRDLLVGSEGTLGVITAAALRLFPRPKTIGTALLAVPGPQAALALLALAGKIIGDEVSAFELMSGVGLDFLAETMPDLRQPFAERPDWMVLIDVGTNSAANPSDVLEQLYLAGMKDDLVHDGLIAQSEAQRKSFWDVRENLPHANRRIGAIVSHDISLPLGAVSEFIEKANSQVLGLRDMRINCFGHLGDGNLHFNVFPAKGMDRSAYAGLKDDIQRVVHDLVDGLGGSISAEHGIGRAKVQDLARYGDPAKLATMRAIKAAMDPNGIMNPGAIFGSI